MQRHFEKYLSTDLQFRKKNIPRMVICITGGALPWTMFPLCSWDSSDNGFHHLDFSRMGFYPPLTCGTGIDGSARYVNHVPGYSTKMFMIDEIIHHGLLDLVGNWDGFVGMVFRCRALYSCWLTDLHQGFYCAF